MRPIEDGTIMFRCVSRDENCQSARVVLLIDHHFCFVWEDLFRNSPSSLAYHYGVEYVTIISINLVKSTQTLSHMHAL
jgi:hypothetical protein